MFISQKCQYAIRAVFELSRINNGQPVKINNIAESQGIPVRFCEVILSQLKQGGFIESRRGSDGGYLMTRPPENLHVGEIIRFIQGSIGPIDGLEDELEEGENKNGSPVFSSLWKEVREAISNVYDNTTFQNLVDRDAQMRAKFIANYSI